MDPLTEPRLDDPDTWPHWPTLRLVRELNDQIVEGWMVDIETYRSTIFTLDGHRFHAAVEDPDYPLSNLPNKEYPSIADLLRDGWSPTF